MVKHMLKLPMDKIKVNDLKIFENDDYIAFNKPSGLNTVPDRFNPEIPCLSRLAADYFGDIFTVHRLDKDTSGVVVFAKNREAHRLLNIEFDQGRVKKQYIAVIEGIPEQRNDRIDLKISEDSKKKGRMIISESGKKSVTDYKIQEFFKDSCLVLVTPRTGRTHQIRVHFAAIGHPILNDRFYGNFSGKGRLMLHSSSIMFDIKGKKKVEINADFDGEFESVVEKLRESK